MNSFSPRTATIAAAAVLSLSLAACTAAAPAGQAPRTGPSSSGTAGPVPSTSATPATAADRLRRLADTLAEQPGDAKDQATYPYTFIRSQHWDRATNVVDRRDETWWRARNGSGEAYVRRLPERRDLTRMPSRQEHLDLKQAPSRTDRYPEPGRLAPMLTEPIPSDQATLTARLAEHAPPENGPQAALWAVCELASHHYLDQATRASALRILADVDGLAYTGAAEDIAGRTGLWFRLDTPGNRDILSVDPRTGRLLVCAQTIANTPSALFSYALYLETDRVARAGQRPDPRAAGRSGRSAT